MGISGVNSTHVQATATVSANAQGFCGVIVTAGADAATAVVRSGGATGSIIATLNAALGTTESITLDWPIGVNGDLHVTVTGTTPDVNVMWK